MRSRVCVILFILAFLMAFASRSPKRLNAEEVNIMKPFTVKTLWGDKTATIGRDPWKEEKPIILHFWGTWCGPCRDEFPSFMKFAVEHPEFSVAAISINDDRATLLRFLKNVNFPLTSHPLAIFLSNEDKDALGYSRPIVGVPTTVFINVNGKIVHEILGGIDWQDSKANEEILKKLVEAE